LLATKLAGQKICWPQNWQDRLCSFGELTIEQRMGLNSLQNRRDFLRILGEETRKRGEREARVTRAGRSAKKSLLPARVTRASRSPRFRVSSPKIRKKTTPVLQARALKKQKAVVRISSGVKEFWTSLFNKGAMDLHQKAMPADVVEQIKETFPVSEWVEVQTVR